MPGTVLCAGDPVIVPALLGLNNFIGKADYSSNNFS